MCLVCEAETEIALWGQHQGIESRRGARTNKLVWLSWNPDCGARRRWRRISATSGRRCATTVLCWRGGKGGRETGMSIAKHILMFPMRHQSKALATRENSLPKCAFRPIALWQAPPRTWVVHVHHWCVSQPNLKAPPLEPRCGHNQCMVAPHPCATRSPACMLLLGAQDCHVLIRLTGGTLGRPCSC